MVYRSTKPGLLQKPMCLGRFVVNSIEVLDCGVLSQLMMFHSSWLRTLQEGQVPWLTTQVVAGVRG